MPAKKPPSKSAAKPAKRKKPRYMKGGRCKASTLPKGPNGLALCRFCKKTECKPPRRTFCSDACVHEYKLRTSGSYLRDCVYKRDKGICLACGTDTKKIAKELWAYFLTAGLDALKVRMKEQGIPATRKIWPRKYGGGLWDADHIIPVEHGGGSCSLENLQTLCIPCHAIKTKQQRQGQI